MPVATAEQIDSYEASPAAIMAAIEGLTEAQLLHEPGEGEWSIHKVLIHLADSEAVSYWRIRKTLAEDEPELAAYDEAKWADELHYNLQDRNLALRLFGTLRSSTATLLRTIPQASWERIGIHAENGRMTIYDLFHLYLEHGNVHLHQIERIKQSV